MLPTVGLALTLLAALVGVLLYRNGLPRGVPIPVLLRRGRTGDDLDPVAAVAAALAEGAQRVGKTLIVPTYVALRWHISVVALLRSNPLAFVVQVAEAAESLLEVRARRLGIAAPKVDRRTMTVSVFEGDPAVTVSFEAPGDHPFTQPAPSDEFGTSRTDEDRLVAETDGAVREVVPDLPAAVSVPVPRTLDPKKAPARLITTEIPGRPSIVTVLPQRADTTLLRWGRGGTNDVVLPEIPGVSEFHLEISCIGGFLYAVDRSTYGSYLERDAGWEPLTPNAWERLGPSARLSLDPDHSVLITVAAS